MSALHLKEQRGAEITSVDHDAPAGKAGLKEHDVILEVNGTRIQGADQCVHLIHEIPSGRNVELLISRHGQPMNISLQLADREQYFAQYPNKLEVEFTVLDTGDYHATLLGSNHVRYVVSCGGPTVFERDCELTAGQVLTGSVDGSTLFVTVYGKSRSHVIETSVYVSPTTASVKSDSSSPVQQPSTEPVVLSPLSDSGEYFLTHCETEQDKIATAACKIWIDAFMNGLVTGMAAATEGEAEFDPEKNNIVCLTKTTTYSQVFPLILKYIRDHPAERKDPTAALAFSALQEAFPCKH